MLNITSTSHVNYTLAGDDRWKGAKVGTYINSNQVCTVACPWASSMGLVLLKTDNYHHFEPANGFVCKFI